MTAIELARQVRAVRMQQKQYYRTRMQDDLEASKRMERALDKLLDEILADRPAKVNMMGFDPE